MSWATTLKSLSATRRNVDPLLDVALAAAVFAGSLVMLSRGRADPTGIVLAACSTLPLVGWRRFPFAVFAVTGVAGVFLASLGYQLFLMPGPTVALYLLAASRHAGFRWTRNTAAATLALLVVQQSVSAIRHSLPAIELLHVGLGWAVAWFAGERTRLGRERLAELEERARRSEREAERERLLAAAQERARIARDLHDSAGHAITVIAVRAGAARLRYHQDPDRSLRALEAIEELARETAEEIDHIVGNLRDGGSPSGIVEAPPGLASLDTLISHHRAAGLDVGVDTVGAQRPLGRAADQAAYRILQEALTNASRHGAGCVGVELAFGDDAIELTITNPTRADAVARTGSGHGLIGMRERALRLGGSVDAGRSNDVFRVRASIPDGDHGGNRS